MPWYRRPSSHPATPACCRSNRNSSSRKTEPRSRTAKVAPVGAGSPPMVQPTRTSNLSISATICIPASRSARQYTKPTGTSYSSANRPPTRRRRNIFPASNRASTSRRSSVGKRAFAIPTDGCATCPCATARTPCTSTGSRSRSPTRRARSLTATASSPTCRWIAALSSNSPPAAVPDGRSRTRALTLKTAVGGGNRAGMRAGDFDGGRSRMAHPFGDGVQQQRPAGDGFSMPIRLGQTNEDVPPIVKQRDEARGQTTTRQVVGDEAAPAPLVLQFVENILPVAAIAIELAEARQVLDEGGRENRIFVNILAGADVDERELRLALIVHRGRRQRTLDAPPQHDDPALPAPALQSDGGLRGLPALAGIDPLALPGKSPDRE